MITITNVRPILTNPGGQNLVVVKVETSEPGLYGVGCATFTQRYMAVRAAVVEHLQPLLVGRDVDRIEELFQLMMIHGYWRNGPVLNNAIAGVDIALWDIKAKRAGMPLYQLLGGKCREAAAVYRHAGGKDPKELEDNVHKFLEQGVRHVRCQCGGYGGLRYEGARPDGALDGSYFHPRSYMRSNLAAIEHVRKTIGDEVELLHDVHERLKPAEAVEFAKRMEPLHLFFLEDILAPEDLEWFANIRQVCSTPIAMGELFNHPREWTPLIAGPADRLHAHAHHPDGRPHPRPAKSRPWVNCTACAPPGTAPAMSRPSAMPSICTWTWSAPPPPPPPPPQLRHPGVRRVQ